MQSKQNKSRKTKESIEINTFQSTNHRFNGITMKSDRKHSISIDNWVNLKITLTEKHFFISENCRVFDNNIAIAL